MNYWLRIDNQNSMGVPLELRLPFLDYRVVEFGFKLPMEFLIRDGWMKWLLRSAMEDLLPADVVWRKRKMGFPFPLKQWLGRFKARILSMIQPLDSPYLDMKRFIAGYETIRAARSRLFMVFDFPGDVVEAMCSRGQISLTVNSLKICAHL